MNGNRNCQFLLPVLSTRWFPSQSSYIACYNDCVEQSLYTDVFHLATHDRCLTVNRFSDFVPLLDAQVIKSFQLAFWRLPGASSPPRPWTPLTALPQTRFRLSTWETPVITVVRSPKLQHFVELWIGQWVQCLSSTGRGGMYQRAIRLFVEFWQPMHFSA